MSTKRRFHTPYDKNCCIPHHAWLVVILDDFLDRLDPIGIVCGRIAPHEYLPEIPDLLFLMTTNTITYENVNKVFEDFFGDCCHPDDQATERIVDFMTEKREQWLFMMNSDDSSRSSYQQTDL